MWFRFKFWWSNLERRSKQRGDVMLCQYAMQIS